MALFRCNACNQEYEDYYPPDDTCLKCKRGTVRIINRYEKQLSTKTVDNPINSMWISLSTIMCYTALQRFA
jgi:hypothetical protein